MSIARKAVVDLQLLGDHLASRRAPIDFAPLFEDLETYDRALRRFSGKSLADARVLEIGYGARPFRLLALQSLGIDVLGVDAEAPILDGSLAEYRAAYRRNGIERVLKSLVRRTFFDRRERRAFAEELHRRGLRPRVERSRLLVADAADLDVADGSLDFVFSEDVFEHIGRESLERLLPRIAAWLRSDGIALIRPNVFTGITGGHHVEWNRRSFAVGRSRRRSDPWDHLRERRFKPNTYLNELWLRDYRRLFQEHFVILEEVVTSPDLGREYLTGRVAAELAAVPDEELFSNQVRFTLRPRPRRR